MSSQKEFMQWQQERAKELFSLSHRLLETAKEFGDHQATEIKASMEYAKSFAKQAATNDLAKLKDLQERFSDEASTRVAAYQKKLPKKLISILIRLNQLWRVGLKKPAKIFQRVQISLLM